MKPVVLGCAPCGVRVEGVFEGGGNEFSRLTRDELHLLRIFVHTEGSIREMESALGISYPTVKARVGALREKLGMPKGGAEVGAEAGMPAAGAVAGGGSVGGEGKGADVGAESQVAAVLGDMKAGRVSAADAARLIRELRNVGK